MQALRSVEKYLNLDALYVLGTNCVDNGPRQGLEKFLNAASSDPDTVLHYEFMQVPPHYCCFCCNLESLVSSMGCVHPNKRTPSGFLVLELI